MANVNPQSENFFYWAPEDLSNYAHCERGSGPGLRSESESMERSTVVKTMRSGSEFISPITALLRKKGAIL